MSKKFVLITILSLLIEVNFAQNKQPRLMPNLTKRKVLDEVTTEATVSYPAYEIKTSFCLKTNFRCVSLLNSFFYIECFCTKMSFFFPSNSVIIFLNGRIFSSSNSKSKMEEDCWQQQFFAIFAKKSLLLAFTEILPCQSHVFKRDFFLKMKS